MHAKAIMNPDALKRFEYNSREINNVAEHELGHAIGLAHSHYLKSVMYASNRDYSIQPDDIRGVQQLYSKTFTDQSYPRTVKH